MFGDGGAGKEARRARQEEEARKRKVAEGTAKVRKQFENQFNWDYYEGPKGLRQTVTDADNLDYARQYNKAVQSLSAALARSGLQDSTIGVQRYGELTNRDTLTRQAMKDRAQAAVDTRKKSVAASEADVTSQLQASADTSSALNQASQRIAYDSAMPQVPPLGQIFGDLSAGLATQADLEQQGTNRYNLGISGLGNSMRRYMRTIGSGG